MKITRRDVLKVGATQGVLASAMPQMVNAGSTDEKNLTADRTAFAPDYRLNVTQIPYERYGSSFNAIVAEGTWPGAEIRYRKGDTFRVMVQNHLNGPTCVHWHGLLLPALMDGVPGISQLPIAAGAVDYYEFPILQSGTYYYHSHFETQEQYGLLGPLILEDPDEPHHYDHDQTVMLCDIPGSDAKQTISDLRSGKMKPDSAVPYLPDGSKEFDTDVAYPGYTINGHSNDDPWTLRVRSGDRIRLRLINSSGSSYFRVKLDDLQMSVIATDGKPVEPVLVDDLVIATAERYDVIVTVPASGNHTLHAAALGVSGQAVGIIHTNDITPKADSSRARFSGKSLRQNDLRAVEPSDLGKVDIVHDVVLGGNMKAFEWTINGNFWPEPFAGPGAKETFLSVQEGSVVRLRMINKTMMAHPMHLHGHVFRRVRQRDNRFAPFKDTISVGAGETVEIEFLANNPGTWAYHCHNIWHLAVGMMQPVRYMLPMGER